MKKIFLIVGSWFFITVADNQYSFLPQRNNVDCYNKKEILVVEENSSNGDKNQLEDSLSEYDHYVVDAIKPAKTSDSRAFFTQLGCAVLLRYIVLQEKAKNCFFKFKNYLSTCFKF